MGGYFIKSLYDPTFYCFPAKEGWIRSNSGSSEDKILRSRNIGVKISDIQLINRAYKHQLVVLAFVASTENAYKYTRYFQSCVFAFLLPTITFGNAIQYLQWTLISPVTLKSTKQNKTTNNCNAILWNYALSNKKNVLIIKHRLTSQ